MIRHDADAVERGVVRFVLAMSPVPERTNATDTHDDIVNRPPRPADVATKPLDFGDVCSGWTAEGWAHELHRKADRCDEYRPDIAAYYRAWAAYLERWHGGPG